MQAKWESKQECLLSQKVMLPPENLMSISIYISLVPEGLKLNKEITMAS